jgi:hypothetical protein
VLKPQSSVMWHKTVIDWLKRWTGPNAATAAQSGATDAKPQGKH